MVLQWLGLAEGSGLRGSGQLVDGLSQRGECLTAGPGRVQPAIGTLLERPRLLAQSGEAEGASRARQAVQTLVKINHHLPALLLLTNQQQPLGTLFEGRQFLFQAVGKLLVQSPQLVVQRFVGAVIHA